MDEDGTLVQEIFSVLGEPTAVRAVSEDRWTITGAQNVPRNATRRSLDHYALSEDEAADAGPALGQGEPLASAPATLLKTALPSTTSISYGMTIVWLSPPRE